jgi:hypothetical protein
MSFLERPEGRDTASGVNKRLRKAYLASIKGLMLRPEPVVDASLGRLIRAAKGLRKFEVLASRPLVDYLVVLFENGWGDEIEEMELRVFATRVSDVHLPFPLGLMPDLKVLKVSSDVLDGTGVFEALQGGANPLLTDLHLGHLNSGGSHLSRLASALRGRWSVAGCRPLRFLRLNFNARRRGWGPVAANPIQGLGELLASPALSRLEELHIYVVSGRGPGPAGAVPAPAWEWGPQGAHDLLCA